MPAGMHLASLLKSFQLLVATSAIAMMVLSCGNTTDGNQIKTVPPPKPSEPEISDTAAAVREYPLLTESNAAEFLLNYFKENPERTIALSTRLGTIKFKLYDDTPLHTGNFLMLVKRGYFNNTEFTRVIKDFVVQGGNNENEIEQVKRLLIGTYLLDPEMNEKHLHKRGALSAARKYEGNPDKRSSPYNFYFVHGRTFNEPQFMAFEREHKMSIPAWKRAIYEKDGGAPHLDGQHTVFGEIISGWDVLDKMAATPTDESDWPLEPLIMEMNTINE